MKTCFSLSPIGPNRRSDKTLIEKLYRFEEQELNGFLSSQTDIRTRVHAQIQKLASALQLPQGELAGETAAQKMVMLFCETSILLQQSAGHDVSAWALLDRDQALEAHCWFEHEEVDVGSYAGELAWCLIAGLWPNLSWKPFVLDATQPFDQLYTEFSKFANERRLPADTAALVAAAIRADIPVVKMEREPYQGIQGDFRIRPNSMLMLGHGRHKHLVDGTLCVDRTPHLVNLRSNPMALITRLLPQFPRGLMARQANDSEQKLNILVANHQVISIQPEVELLPATRTWLEQLSKQLNVGLLSVGLGIAKPEMALNVQGGSLTRLDTAPDLSGLASESPELLQQAAEAYMHWLFKPGTPSRIPTLAVTGTNGKTTTSRMTDQIMQRAGHRTSLKCSDGLYVNNTRMNFDGPDRPDVYYQPFELEEVDLAVQEVHFGRILRAGFPWHWCNVAICTNVTTDHIGRLGVENLDDMAEVKGAVIQRARDAAVLNADDAYSANMTGLVSAGETWLVSREQNVEELRSRFGAEHKYCVVEARDGQDWIVLYSDRQMPVLPVNDIPATFKGTALFNISNALLATAAGFALGATVDDIRQGLIGFRTDMSMGLGRMNIYDGHPFKVILDFAHNADGIRQVGEFLNRQAINGRKIMLIAAAGEREDVDIIEKGKAAAEYFDHFVVRSYPDPRGRERQDSVDHMTRFLLEAGVSESQITGVADPDEGTLAILKEGRPGDWLVLNWGNGEAEKMWKMITTFEPEL